MKANLNRGIVVFTSLLAGLVIGLFAGGYIYYAWMPTEAILKNAPPKDLTFDAENLTPQYRDFYLVRAANRYQRDLQAGSPDPLSSAYDVLGVTTGDTSMEDSISMVRTSEKVAVKENTVDGDAGVFTKNDELALGALGSALETAKASGSFPKPDLSKYPPNVARANARIIGFIVLILLALLAGVVIYVVDHWVGNRVNGATTINQTFRVQPTQTLREPTPNPSPSSVTINVNPGSTSPTSPGVATVPGRTAVVSAPTEAPLAVFAPTVYRHGDDHYDEDFAINGPLGELVGECGASIADRIGVDTPARVSALSLWVFDKNDFQSTTKVLMTENAWNDPVVRTKLKARGEAVLATEGGVIEILTSTLRVQVQVSDLSLNTDNNPPHGYFQSVTLTFSVYSRPASV